MPAKHRKSANNPAQAEEKNETSQSRSDRFIDAQPRKFSGGARILFLFFIITSGAFLFYRASRSFLSKPIAPNMNEKPKANQTKQPDKVLELCTIDTSKVEDDKYKKSADMILSALKRSLQNNPDSHVKHTLDKNFNPNCNDPVIIIAPAQPTTNFMLGVNTKTVDEKLRKVKERRIEFYALADLETTNAEEKMLDNIVAHELYHAYVIKLIENEFQRVIPRPIVSHWDYLHQYNISSSTKDAIDEGNKIILNRVPQLLANEKNKSITKSETSELQKYRNAAKDNQPFLRPRFFDPQSCGSLQSTTAKDMLKKNIEIEASIDGENHRIASTFSSDNGCGGKTYVSKNEPLENLVSDTEFYMNLHQAYHDEAKRFNEPEVLTAEMHARIMEKPKLHPIFYPKLIPVNAMVLQKGERLRVKAKEDKDKPQSSEINRAKL